MRPLQRPQRDRHVRIVEVRAGVAERVADQTGPDAGVGVRENLAGLLVIDLVIVEFEWRHPAADPHFQPAMAQMIEHADFLDQPQRRIERKEIDERTEPDPRGRAGDRAEINTGYRHHVERRTVMLGHVQAIDARLVGGCHEGEALVEQGRQRPVRAFHMVEQADFHDFFRFRARAPRSLVPAASGVFARASRASSGCRPRSGSLWA